MLKFGTKNALFMNFWTRIWKQYCHRLNQYRPYCLIGKVDERKIPKFEIKSALFGYLWVTILKKLLSYLKSALSNLSNCKISKKKKKRA